MVFSRCAAPAVDGEVIPPPSNTPGIPTAAMRCGCGGGEAMPGHPQRRRQRGGTFFPRRRHRILTMSPRTATHGPSARPCDASLAKDMEIWPVARRLRNTNRCTQFCGQTAVGEYTRRKKKEEIWVRIAGIRLRTLWSLDKRLRFVVQDLTAAVGC